ncbi:hypothetical protein M0R72_11285 [Candidatus Pacearchaeota archaeon]|nr:hypothetical protein [Candidatus Pacearchaeota archaeon]
MKYKDWQEQILREIQYESAITHWMHGVRFLSKSAGKGRRRPPRLVTLLQFNGDRRSKRWRSWSGEDRQDNGRIPWDQWATEMGLDCQQARDEFEQVLVMKGRF